MKFRPFSVFSVIAYILVALAIAGLIGGPHFVFDPGQNVGSHANWYLQPIYYFAVGILMFLNGLWTPVVLPTDDKKKDDQKDNETKHLTRRERRAAAAASSDTTSQK